MQILQYLPIHDFFFFYNSTRHYLSSANLPSLPSGHPGMELPKPPGHSHIQPTTPGGGTGIVYLLVYDFH